MTQEQALKILSSGQSVFLTGEPGAGKSHTIREFMKRTRRLVALTASTGIAATNIGGQTIHAWSGIGARQALTKTDVYAIRNGPAGRRMRAADALVIDEISMLSGDVLQMVDFVARVARDAYRTPFGGLQVILVGDFFQLPAVKHERWRFAFEAPAWDELGPEVCYLHEQHRQNDPEFLALLSLIRSDECSADNSTLLSRRVRHDRLSRDIPLLLTKNELVDRFNAAQLEDLPGAPETYRMTSYGGRQQVSALIKGCQSPEALTLKDGAVVIFTRNDPMRRFVNGSVGEVVEKRGADGWPIVRLKDGSTVAAEPMEWEVTEPIDEEKIDITARPQRQALRADVFSERRMVASIRQVPLRLAWGITIHKSQGMSLDEAAMDLSGAFAYGQGYVALSRVRSLGGLYLLGWNPKALRVHPDVLAKDFDFLAASSVLEVLHNRAELRQPHSGTLSATLQPVDQQL